MPLRGLHQIPPAIIAPRAPLCLFRTSPGTAAGPDHFCLATLQGLPVNRRLVRCAALHAVIAADFFDAGVGMRIEFVSAVPAATHRTGW
jgi:hypothetical protein